MPAGRLMFWKSDTPVDGDSLIPVGESTPMPVSTVGSPAGTAADSDDIAVDNTAGGVTILAANANRKSAMIQNVGSANMRVTTDDSAPTATHGKQVGPGDSLVLSQPNCPTAAVKAIREGASDTTASVSEVS